jgi:hypothetical protein
MTYRPIIHIVVEGETEEAFVNHVLTAAFKQLEISPKKPRNLRSWKSVRDFIVRLLNNKSNTKSESYVTTMFDFYGLPSSFPGLQEAKGKTAPPDKAHVIEEAMRKCVNDNRFIPYIQLHEFEALLFARPEAIAETLRPARPQEWQKELRDIEKNFPNNPEYINQRDQYAPSKRLKRHFPEYEKVVHGPLIAERIGLPTVCDKCSHFNDWLMKLESLRQVASKP